MAKFYGDKEIVDTREDGNGKQVLVFADGKEEVLSKKMVAVTVSEESCDLTALRDKRCFPVVAEILGVLLDWDVKIEEVDFIDARVIMSINESLKKANNTLWNKTEGEKTMGDVDRVLKS